MTERAASVTGVGHAVIAARALAAAGREVKAQRASLGSTVAARPWGDDDAGRAFDDRYRAIERSVLGAWAQLGNYVEELGAAAERLAAPERS